MGSPRTVDPPLLRPTQLLQQTIINIPKRREVEEYKKGRGCKYYVRTAFALFVCFFERLLSVLNNLSFGKRCIRFSTKVVVVVVEIVV